MQISKFLYAMRCILFVVSASFSSCKGQNTARIDDKPLNKRLAPASNQAKAEPGLGDSLWIVFQDSKQNYWFGSNGEGVYRYSKTGGKLPVRYTRMDGLCNDSIRQIQEDRAGNLYFTTPGGISKFDGKTFTTLRMTGRSGSVWKLQADDLWFMGAQDSGVVYRYDGETLQRLEFPKTKAGEAFISNYPRSEYPFMTFSPYDVYTIYKDRKGVMWFGTGSLGICRYNGTSFTWISENGLGASPVRSIIEDKRGTFWFGNSDRGFYRYDGKTVANYRDEKHIGNLKERGKGSPVSYNSVAEDESGELWIATYSTGVWRYDGKTVTHYPIKDDEGTVNLISIYKDRLGIMWLGTSDAGAYKFNGKGFERFRP